MKLLGDYHTHSKNSRFFHGKNTIEEIVNQANMIGLVEVAITDHGYRHVFRTSKEKLVKARKLIDEINKTSKTKVLLGYEADIISEDGTIDIDSETMELIDILLAGYHRMTVTDFAGFFGKQEDSPEAIEKCTNAYINAIKKYPISIITHLNSVLKVDLYKIGCACSDNDVFVELNNRHLNFSEKDIEDLVASGCSFVVNSDAHTREDVGKVDLVFDLIKKYNIPTENLMNVEFSYDEMTEEHKEIQAYYNIYQQKQNERQKKERALEEKRATEFTEKLSDEMEAALSEIARERGLKYTPVKDEIDFYEGASFEDEEANEILRRAYEYLQRDDVPSKSVGDSAPVDAHEGEEPVDDEIEETSNLEDSQESVIQNELSENEMVEEPALEENEAELVAENNEILPEPSDKSDDEDFKFNMGMHYTKGTKNKNLGTEIIKNDKAHKNKSNKGKLLN